MPTDRELLDQLATEYADYKSRAQRRIDQLENHITPYGAGFLVPLFLSKEELDSVNAREIIERRLNDLKQTIYTKLKEPQNDQTKKRFTLSISDLDLRTYKGEEFEKMLETRIKQFKEMIYEQTKSSETQGSPSGETENPDLREAGGEEDMGIFGLSEAVLY